MKIEKDDLDVIGSILYDWWDLMDTRKDKDGNFKNQTWAKELELIERLLGS